MTTTLAPSSSNILDPTFTRLLTKTFISSDFADSQDNTFAETQALLSLAGIDILQEVHLARFKEIARTIKFSEVSAANTGTGVLGTVSGSFTNVEAVDEGTAYSLFNQILLLAAAQKIYKKTATIASDFPNIAAATNRTAAYLAQAVSPGVGPSWYKNLLSFTVGSLPFKIQLTPGTPGTYNITELLSTNTTDYPNAAFYIFPSNFIRDDFTAAVALRTNNGSSIMKPNDLPSGTFKARAAVYLATGKDTSDSSTNLSTINKATDVLAITSLINYTPSGNILLELNSLISDTNKRISASVIGDASLSDARLSSAISELPYNDSYAYAIANSTKLIRSVDFVTNKVYAYPDTVNKLNDWLKLVKKDASVFSQILLNNDSTASAIKTDLLKGEGLTASEALALAYTSSTLEFRSPSDDKQYIKVYNAIIDALSTGTSNLSKLSKPEDIAEYLSSKGTGANVTLAPEATAAPSTNTNSGINALEGNWNTLLTSIKNDPNPSISLDDLYNALVIVANQNNKYRSTIEDPNKIIAIWFPSTGVVSQKPTTVPGTNANVFWSIPETDVYTEDHSKRLMANYIAVNYDIRLLRDPRNNKYFDLLFKAGTDSGVSVNVLQATNLFAYNPALINGNVPSSTKIGTAEEIFAILNTKDDLSTYTKVRLYTEIKHSVANVTADIMDLISFFGKEVIYGLPEVPLQKDGTTESINPTTTATATGYLSHPSNFPNGTSTLYNTFPSNNETHKKQMKRSKVISKLIDIFNEDPNKAITANKNLELAKISPDFGAYVRFHTNFGTNNKTIFSGVIQNWLGAELAPSIEEIVVSSNTYSQVVKTAIMNYIQNGTNTGPTLGLSVKNLSAATDTITKDNSSLLTPSVTASVLSVANLTAKVFKKDKNVDVPSSPDTPLKLSEILGTPGKLDQLLAGLVASILDGSNDPTKLNGAGRLTLLEAGMSPSDVSLLVLAKNKRSNPWVLSNETLFQYLAGQDQDGVFVSDPQYAGP